MIALAISMIGLALTVIATAVSVARGIGRLEQQSHDHGASLASHRTESATALGALRTDLGDVRSDIGDLRERVAGVEMAAKLRAVR